MGIPILNWQLSKKHMKTRRRCKQKIKPTTSFKSSKHNLKKTKKANEITNLIKTTSNFPPIRILIGLLNPRIGWEKFISTKAEKKNLYKEERELLFFLKIIELNKQS